MPMPSDDPEFEKFYNKIELVLWSLIVIGVFSLFILVVSLLFHG